MTIDDDPSADPLLGQTLGNCRLEEVLGRGAMGAVYRATQEGLQRTVAVKVLWAELAANKKYVSRFERESRLIAQMRHPNIVDVYSAGVHGDHRFLVMEFVEGRPLSQLIRERGALPPDYARGIMLQACHGLEAAWRHGVIHRDIKPDNLLVTTQGVVKVADFGLAKNVDEGTDLTRVGQIMGTPLYMSPEQAEGRKADIRADIYALGISFWHALAGRPPYQAETALALLRAHVDKPLPDVRELNPEVSDALWAVIQRMCAKDRDNRYADPVALAAALEDPGAEVAGTVMDLIEADAAAAAGAGAQTIEDLAGSDAGLPAVSPDAETIHDPAEPPPGASTTTHGRSRSRAPAVAGAVILLGGAIGAAAWLGGAGPVTPTPSPAVPPAPAPASAAAEPSPAPAPAAAPVVPPPPDPAEQAYTEAMARARSAVAQGRWDDAEGAIVSALEARPGDAGARDLLTDVESGRAHVRERERAAAAEAARRRQLQAELEAFQAALAGNDLAGAEQAARRALDLVPNDPDALKADKLWRDAAQAAAELDEGTRLLAAGRWDDAVAAVQRARRLFTPVPGATELLERIRRGRTAAEQLGRARAAAQRADWPATAAAAAAALEAGASDPDATRLQTLATRGVQLASADAELPHAKAKAVRRLLPNGVEVLVLPVKAVPGTVRAGVAVRYAGSAFDRGDVSGTGIGALTRRMLSPAATARRSRIEARGMLQALDAQVSGYDGKDHLRLGLTAPAENLEMILGQLAAWIGRPTLPVADYHKVRGELRAMVYARSKERWAIEWRQLSSAVWGAHPWSDDAEGSVPGLDRLTQRAVVDYHAARFVPRRLVLTIAGECDPAEALRLAGAAFGGLQGASPPPPALPPLPEASLPDRIQRAVPGLDGATVFFAWRTVRADHPDRPALDAAAAVLGRITKFRLAPIVAGQERTAQARHWSEVQVPGLLYLGVRCAAADVAEVERGIAAAVASLADEPPTPAELRQATALLQPAIPPGPDGLASLSGDLLRTTLFAEAPGYWAEIPTRLGALTPGDVARAARERLAPEQTLTLVLLPAD